MCELLAAAFPEPRPFDELAGAAELLERYGLAGYGWGVAWLDDGGTGQPGAAGTAHPSAAGTVRVVRNTGRFVDEALTGGLLGRHLSRRWLVHLRRPSRLLTVSMADTQPFAQDGEYAFCHNGFLERAEQLRPQFADRLEGRADSEVGWAWFQDRLAAGADPEAALRGVDETFGGTVNLAYLGADGRLAVYAGNKTNPMWQFRLGGGELAATALHSDDDAVFDWIFSDATDRRRLDASGTVGELGGPVRSAA
ncbi:MAG TPA: hypothetical protein VKV06_01715 [Acidimicrobiales bacterium]|nr:hypothetical protein [Acidimicrobiales bacterium]